ncbi:MAG: hypothetical protein SF002_04190 [Alphaproteobacteria bacterium]|nr:hypothetical protein [Alphaproteobacteria bacterium]
MRFLSLVLLIILSACNAGQTFRPTTTIDPQKALVIIGFRNIGGEEVNHPEFQFKFWPASVQNGRLEYGPGSVPLVIGNFLCRGGPFGTHAVETSDGVCFYAVAVDARPFVLYEMKGYASRGFFQGGAPIVQYFGLDDRGPAGRRRPENILWLNLTPGEVRFVSVQNISSSAEVLRQRSLGQMAPITQAQVQELLRLLPQLAGRQIVKQGFDRESDLARRQ